MVIYFGIRVKIVSEGDKGSDNTSPQPDAEEKARREEMVRDLVDFMGSVFNSAVSPKVCRDTLKKTNYNLNEAASLLSGRRFGP